MNLLNALLLDLEPGFTHKMHAAQNERWDFWGGSTNSYKISSFLSPLSNVPLGNTYLLNWNSRYRRQISVTSSGAAISEQRRRANRFSQRSILLKVKKHQKWRLSVLFYSPSSKSQYNLKKKTNQQVSRVYKLHHVRCVNCFTTWNAIQHPRCWSAPWCDWIENELATFLCVT